MNRIAMASFVAIRCATVAGTAEKEVDMRACGVCDPGFGQDITIAVVHRREIVFVNQRRWVMFDMITGVGKHQIEARFQFAPGRLHIHSTTARTGFDDANLLLVAAG